MLGVSLRLAEGDLLRALLPEDLRELEATAEELREMLGLGLALGERELLEQAEAEPLLLERPEPLREPEPEPEEEAAAD